MLSDRFINFKSPPKHSAHISMAQILSLTCNAPSTCIPPERNIRRFTRSICSQFSGTGLFKKSIIRPSFPDASLWVSCCSTTAASRFFGIYSSSPPPSGHKPLPIPDLLPAAALSIRIFSLDAAQHLPARNAGSPSYLLETRYHWTFRRTRSAAGTCPSGDRMPPCRYPLSYLKTA